MKKTHTFIIPLLTPPLHTPRITLSSLRLYLNIVLSLLRRGFRWVSPSKQKIESARGTMGRGKGRALFFFLPSLPTTQKPPHNTKRPLRRREYSTSKSPKVTECVRQRSKVNTLLLKRCALRKFHVIDDQNTRD